MWRMSRAALLAAVIALTLPAAAAADGFILQTPLLGATVSSAAPVEFAWDNPNYHVLGETQILKVATDPDIQNVVYRHGDHCEPYMLCPQTGPFAPGTYYWRMHLLAWDWNPYSDVWSFVSATAPPPPPPPPPPSPPPPPKRTCHVPMVRGKTLAQARPVIRSRR